MSGLDSQIKKAVWKPGSMIYPVPAVMVSCGDYSNGADMNIITVIYTGAVCTTPHRLFISLKPERYSYGIIKKYGDFVLNLTTEKLAEATDYCGVTSGRDVNKFEKTKLTPVKSANVNAPSILESPVNIECRLNEIIPAGSHHIFLADVICICADEAFIDKSGKFHLEEAKPICYSHGKYYSLGKALGGFGYSVRKNKGKQKRNKERPV